MQARRESSGIRLVDLGKQPLPAEAGRALVALVLYSQSSAGLEHAATVQALLEHLTAAGPPVFSPPQPAPDADAPPAPQSSRAAAGSLLRVDARSRAVTRLGVEVRLCRREFDLLLYLVEHPGQVFSRLQLLDAVWGDVFTGSRTVDVHVRRLRQKLGPAGLVTTIRGVGYRLATDASVTLVRSPVSVPPSPTSAPAKQPAPRWLDRQGAA